MPTSWCDQRIDELEVQNGKMLAALQAALPILEDMAASGPLVTPMSRRKQVREQVSLTIGAVRGLNKI
jgi:hypothetical protein